MDCKITLSLVTPLVFLIDLNAEEMHHEVRQSSIVIPFHPDGLYIMFRVRKQPDMGKQPPVAPLEPVKIKVFEHVTEKDKPLKTVAFQYCEDPFGPAYVRS